MRFSDTFFGDSLPPSGSPRISYGEYELVRTLDRGFTALDKQADASNQIQAKFADTIERLRESNDSSNQLLADEVSWQAAKIREEIAALANNLVRALDYMAKYLGAGISEVRWAVERNTETTKQILEVELRSHWNDSRQFFEEGILWYEKAERELAEECFRKAVRACSTNAFAYQYLGFLATHRDDRDEAVRNFELAAKSAPDNLHKAKAHYHLALALRASGDGKASLDNAKAAVEYDPGNLVYRYELVRAFVRVGENDGALRELRNVIVADLDYWTRSASDESLDPIRSQISDLLGTFRKERSRAAHASMNRFIETMRVVAAFDDAGLEKLLASARAAFDASQILYEMGTVFACRDAAISAQEGNEQLVQDTISIYQDRISSLRNSLSRREVEHRKRVMDLKRRSAELLKQRDLNLNDGKAKEVGLREAFKSANELSGAATGGLGCLWLIGAVSILAIVGTFIRDTPVDIGKWLLLIAWGALSMLAVIALPRWALRKNREVRSVEKSISEIREEGLKEGLRLLEQAKSALRQAGEEEASGEKEIREMAARFEREQAALLQRIKAMDRCCNG